MKIGFSRYWPPKFLFSGIRFIAELPQRRSTHEKQAVRVFDEVKPASFYKTVDLSRAQFGNYSGLVSRDHSHLISALRAMGKYNACGANSYRLFDLQIDLCLSPLQFHLVREKLN